MVDFGKLQQEAKVEVTAAEVKAETFWSANKSLIIIVGAAVAAVIVLAWLASL